MTHPYELLLIRISITHLTHIKLLCAHCKVAPPPPTSDPQTIAKWRCRVLQHWRQKCDYVLIFNQTAKCFSQAEVPKCLSRTPL